MRDRIELLATFYFFLLLRFPSTRKADLTLVAMAITWEYGNYVDTTTLFECQEASGKAADLMT
jgi:hypothetical protein